MRFWRPEADLVLVEHYGKRPPSEIASLLGRSTAAVNNRASRIGITTRELWSAKEEATLRALWGSEPVESIAKRLSRTPVAVCLKASLVGLRAMPRQGEESLTDAARRCNFDAVTLRNLLVRAGVKRGPSGLFDCFDVDLAVEAYLKTQPIHVHATKRRMVGALLRRWIVAAMQHTNIVIPPRPRKHKFWRLTDETVDEVLVWRDSLESLTAASKRHRRDRARSKRKLIEAQIKLFHFHKTDWVLKTDADRVLKNS